MALFLNSKKFYNTLKISGDFEIRDIASTMEQWNFGMMARPGATHIQIAAAGVKFEIY